MNRHKYNIAVILCLLLSFFTINLSNISISNSISPINKSIDYENPNSYKTIKQEEVEQTEKITEKDLYILGLSIVNVIILTSSTITLYEIACRKYKIKKLHELIIYIIILITIVAFIALYIKMNNSENLIYTIISIDIILFVIDAFITKPYLKQLKNPGLERIKLDDKLTGYNDLTLGQVSAYGINNLVSLKQNIYLLCNDINIAYEQKNTKVLKTKCSKELYEKYINELNKLKNNNYKWHLDSFQYNNCKITNIDDSNDNLIIKAILRVELINYVTDKDNKVVNGFKKKRINNYEIELIRNAIERKLTTCPNCGNSLKTIGSDKCPYCKTVIVSISDDLILNKIKRIKNK